MSGAGQLRNKAAILYGVDDLRYEDYPLPSTLAPGQVRVDMKACGICGSDVHYWKRGRIGDYVVNAPMVIGHESAGVVVEVGPGVKGLSPGDAVALEPGVPCWHNRASREGRYNLDPDIRFFATPPVHGSLARLVDHPADFCFRLPPGMSLEEGAFCEPLSVGVHACRRGGVGPGKTVAVLGAGPIGLVVMLCAKAFGADAVMMTDVRQSPLDVARRLGANATLCEGDAAKVSAWLTQGTNGHGPEVVIDCAGYESTVQAAIKGCARGGTVVMVGMGTEDARIPMTDAIVKELDVKGSFRYCNTYPLCISLMHSGRVNIKPLITHRFGFSSTEEVVKAFETAYRPGETGSIKVMFNIGAEE